MIIYEVNLTVDPDSAEEYATWLQPHIAHILEIDGFLSAEWFERDTAFDGSDADKTRWTIHYRLRDRAALKAYQRDHAPALIREGLDKFGERLTATRRVLQPAETSTPAEVRVANYVA